MSILFNFERTHTPTNSEKVKDTNIGFVKIPSKLKKKLSIRFFSLFSLTSIQCQYSFLILPEYLLSLLLPRIFFLFDILKYSIQFKISIKLKFLSGWLVCHYIIEAGPLLRKKVQSIILYANVCGVCVKKGNSVWFNFLFEVDKLVNRWLVGWMNGYDN